MLARGLFLLVVADDYLYAEASEICQRFSVTRRALTLDVGVNLLKLPTRWAGVVIESNVLGIAAQRGLHQVRDAWPALPCMLLTGDESDGSPPPQRCDALVAQAHSERGRMHLESFTRRALVLELLPDLRVADAVDQLATDLNLTPREVQLIAYALGGEPRHLVLRRLGITVNTLKSQVRTLLRKCAAGSMAELVDWLVRDARGGPQSGRGTREAVASIQRTRLLTPPAWEQRFG